MSGGAAADGRRESDAALAAAWPGADRLARWSSVDLGRRVHPSACRPTGSARPPRPRPPWQRGNTASAASAAARGVSASAAPGTRPGRCADVVDRHWWSRRDQQRHRRPHRAGPQLLWHRQPPFVAPGAASSALRQRGQGLRNLLGPAPPSARAIRAPTAVAAWSTAARKHARMTVSPAAEIDAGIHAVLENASKPLAPIVACLQHRLGVGTDLVCALRVGAQAEEIIRLCRSCFSNTLGIKVERQVHRAIARRGRPGGSAGAPFSSSLSRPGSRSRRARHRHAARSRTPLCRSPSITAPRPCD